MPRRRNDLARLTKRALLEHIADRIDRLENHIMTALDDAVTRYLTKSDTERQALRDKVRELEEQDVLDAEQRADVESVIDRLDAASAELGEASTGPTGTDAAGTDTGATADDTAPGAEVGPGTDTPPAVA